MSSNEEANEPNTSGSSTDSNIEFDHTIYNNHLFRRHATQPLEGESGESNLNIPTDSGSSNAEQSTSDCLNMCQQIHPTQETQDIVDLTETSSDELDTPGTSMIAIQGSFQGSSGQDNENSSVEIISDVASPVVAGSSQGSSGQDSTPGSYSSSDTNDVTQSISQYAAGDPTQSQESQSQQMFPMTLSQSDQDI